MDTRYIFVTGGVASSPGTEIVAASIARLLLAHGFGVDVVRCDPCINPDAASLSTAERGECYVTADGHETTLEMGHYERIAGLKASRANVITTGSIFQSVIDHVQRGDYRGKTVLLTPHVTDEIKHRITSLAQGGKRDFVVCEMCGTVGDIDMLPFLEAARQMRWELGDRCMTVHVTHVGQKQATADPEAKPTLHSVNLLRQAGLWPDALVLRSQQGVSPGHRARMAAMAGVSPEAVIDCAYASTPYEVPMTLHAQRLDSLILEYTHTPPLVAPDMERWATVLAQMLDAQRELKIGIVGRDANARNAYRSVEEALRVACAAHGCKPRLARIDSERLNDATVEQALGGLDGIVVTQDEGQSGFEGCVSALKWCREHDVPTLATGQGMQCMVVELARNVLGLTEANSTQMEAQTLYPVVDLMEAQKTYAFTSILRLGAYACHLQADTRVAQAYGRLEIEERHRHRYELNTDFRGSCEAAGMRCVGENPETRLIEAVEMTGKRWYVGTAFCPELSSTVLNRHPLFLDFVAALANGDFG